LFGVSFLVSCGAQTPEGSDADGSATAAPSRPAEVLFPRVRRGLDGGPTAGMGGKLFVDEKGCLRLDPRRGSSWVPVWPAGLDLERRGGKARIVDGEGRVVAEVGKEVFMGGGQVGLPKEVVSPRTARELRDRCPGDYWIAVAPSMSSAVPQG
jgi:hypothetical protein